MSVYKDAMAIVMSINGKMCASELDEHMPEGPDIIKPGE